MPKQPHQVPTPLEAPEDVDLGTSFSLTNLLTKARIGIEILGFRDCAILGCQDWDWGWKSNRTPSATPPSGSDAPDDVDLGTSFSLEDIQCLRRQEEVGSWSKKCPVLSTFRVKIVYVEVGRWSKMDQILSR